MKDDAVDEISVRFKNDRVLLRWRYLDGPYHYRWFDL